MGWGKKRDDGMLGQLGYLKAMPWEREPLTEIQPLAEKADRSSDVDDRRSAKDACELTSK